MQGYQEVITLGSRGMGRVRARAEVSGRLEVMPLSPYPSVAALMQIKPPLGVPYRPTQPGSFVDRVRVPAPNTCRTSDGPTVARTPAGTVLNSKLRNS